MLNFRRGKSFSTISIYDENSDNISLNPVATRKDEPGTLCLPKNLDDVIKSQHADAPKNLPGENASQEEVRYYLYSVLTCKDNSSAKTYPQWVLETCMSWKGNGQRLRNMTDEELQILCPLKAGYAEINLSRKHKLDVLPLPAARQSIGAAIARAVGANRAAESRRDVMKQNWNHTLRRPSLRYKSAEDLKRQENRLQLTTTPEIRPRSSMLQLSCAESADHLRWNNLGAKTYTPSLPNVEESHSNPSYFQPQDYVSSSRPALPLRHLTESRYAQSADSSSYASPSSSHGLVDSILSQDSNSTSHTSFDGPESITDRFPSPKLDRGIASASPTTSIKQPTPCYEHKETLAELEAGPIEMPFQQEPSDFNKRPLRYRPVSSNLLASGLKSPSSSARDLRQTSDIYRPSGLRKAVHMDDIGQGQIGMGDNHAYPEHQILLYPNNKTESSNFYQMSSMEPGKLYCIPQHNSYSDLYHGQTNHPTQLYSNNMDHSDDSHSKLGQSLLYPTNSMHFQVPVMDNTAPIWNQSAQDFSCDESLMSRKSRQDLQQWSEALELQRQERGDFNHLEWVGSAVSTRNEVGQTVKQGMHQNQPFSRQSNRPHLTCFQSAQDISPSTLPPISNLSVNRTSTFRHREPSRMRSMVNLRQDSIVNKSTPVALRTANIHKVGSLALDLADFHVSKGQLPRERTTITCRESDQLSKSQSDNLLVRARDHKVQTAWNSDLRGYKGLAGPSVRLVNSMTRRPRRTFYEAIEEREILDGKPQRGVDRGLAQEWRRYH